MNNAIAARMDAWEDGQDFSGYMVEERELATDLVEMSTREVLEALDALGYDLVVPS